MTKIHARRQTINIIIEIASFQTKISIWLKYIQMSQNIIKHFFIFSLVEMKWKKSSMKSVFCASSTNMKNRSMLSNGLRMIHGYYHLSVTMDVLFSIVFQNMKNSKYFFVVQLEKNICDRDKSTLFVSVCLLFLLTKKREMFFLDEWMVNVKRWRRRLQFSFMVTSTIVKRMRNKIVIM